MFETAIGIAAGVLTSASTVPQLVKVIREKKVDMLSPVMLVVLLLGVGLWTWYGVMKSELPIILSNAFAFLVNGALLVCYLMYRDKKH
jgi:MtN3 and saliva related transmembrane protein